MILNTTTSSATATATAATTTTIPGRGAKTAFSCEI